MPRLTDDIKKRTLDAIQSTDSINTHGEANLLESLLRARTSSAGSYDLGPSLSNPDIRTDQAKHTPGKRLKNTPEERLTDEDMTVGEAELLAHPLKALSTPAGSTHFDPPAPSTDS